MLHHYQELKDAFQNHFKDTQRQVQRLKKIFTHLGVSPLGKPCKWNGGVNSRKSRNIKEFPVSALRDAALISAAQKVEHYELQDTNSKSLC